MKFVMALAGLALAACAATQAPHDTPHASDTCILLSLGKDAGLHAPLPDSLKATLDRIGMQSLPPPTYQCGDVSYQTDPRQRGVTFTGVGFSADHRYAAVRLQVVAAPMAGQGDTCLFEAADQNWTLRGCRMDWIS